MNTVLLSKCDLGHGNYAPIGPSLSNSTNQILGQLCAMLGAAFNSTFWRYVSSRTSTLSFHVGTIVGGGAKKEVGGIYAGRAVAVVTYKLIGWINFIRQPIANALREVAVSVDVENSITFSTDPCRPLPALTLWAKSGRLVHFCPKTFYLLRCKIGNSTMFHGHVDLLARVNVFGSRSTNCAALLV